MDLEKLMVDFRELNNVINNMPEPKDKVSRKELKALKDAFALVFTVALFHGVINKK